MLDRLVRAYGVRILAEPPDAGFGRVLHRGPWVLGLFSVVGLAFVIRRVTRRPANDWLHDDTRLAAPAAPGSVAPPDDEGYRQRLDDERRDLD